VGLGRVGTILTLLLLLALAPGGARASPIQYAWTGFIEPGSSAPSNPWGLAGDGSAVTQDDGTPLSIEIVVDENAPDGDTDEPGVALFQPSSARILIGGSEAEILNLTLGFFDDDATFVFDLIQAQGQLRLNGTTLSFGAAARLPIGTFDQGPGFVDLPPLFAAVNPIQFGGFGGDVTTYPANAPVSAVLIPAIPEPASAGLLALGLFALAWRRR
jgi:hypothetical protein